MVGLNQTNKLGSLRESVSLSNLKPKHGSTMLYFLPKRQSYDFYKCILSKMCKVYKNICFYKLYKISK